MLQNIQSVVLPDNDDTLLDEHMIANYTSQSLSKLRNDRYLKRGLTYVKLGSLVRYRVGDIRKDIRECTVATT